MLTLVSGVTKDRFRHVLHQCFLELDDDTRSWILEEIDSEGVPDAVARLRTAAEQRHLIKDEVVVARLVLSDVLVDKHSPEIDAYRDRVTGNGPTGGLLIWTPQ